MGPLPWYQRWWISSKRFYASVLLTKNLFLLQINSSILKNFWSKWYKLICRCLKLKKILQFFDVISSLIKSNHVLTVLTSVLIRIRKRQNLRIVCREFYNLTAILTFSTKYFGVHLFRVFFIIKPELVCSIVIDRITGLVIAVLGGKITYL